MGTIHVDQVYITKYTIMTNKLNYQAPNEGMSRLPSGALFFNNGDLQARNWRQIVSSTAFSLDKHLSSPSPLKGRPYAIMKRSSSCEKKVR